MRLDRHPLSHMVHTLAASAHNMAHTGQGLKESRVQIVGSLSDFADRISYSVPMDVVGWPGGPTASCELGLSGAMTYESRFSAFQLFTHQTHALCSGQRSKDSRVLVVQYLPDFADNISYPVPPRSESCFSCVPCSWKCMALLDERLEWCLHGVFFFLFDSDRLLRSVK